MTTNKPDWKKDTLKAFSTEKTRTIVLEPNYDRMFANMLREAKLQGDPKRIFDDLKVDDQITALRALQRFLAPLNIAAQCMTTAEAITQLRDALHDLADGLDKHAMQLEDEQAEDYDPTDGKGLL